MKIAITGGAGFIGSNLVQHFVRKYPEYKIYNLDSLTYAGNLNNLIEIQEKENYEFIKVDINNEKEIQDIFKQYRFNSIIHLAAESHVDRSISNPLQFVKTNVIGTLNLLNSFRDIWQKNDNIPQGKFYHISTDEVFGSLGEEGYFTEETSYAPRSPYSASKASSDHFVRAYGETYSLNYNISNCSNNYGEYQFPEKLIPMIINNIRTNKTIPIYGDGNYTRDWLYVQDHIRAIDIIFHKGKNKETYNIGGLNEYKNIDLVNLLCNLMDRKLDRVVGTSKNLIRFVKDRPGHDKRYAIDASKLMNELYWKPNFTFEQGIEKTVNWYLENSNWLDNVVSGNYIEYYNQQYNK